MVQRLAKGVLPANTSITKDGITAMQKSATVFINHLASQAHESIQTNNRKTIPPQAISEALHDTEFDGFIGRVEAELRRFNEVQTGKRNDYRRKVKEGKNSGGDGVGGIMNVQGRGGRAAGGEEEGEREMLMMGRGGSDNGRMMGEGDVDMDMDEDEDDDDGGGVGIGERAVKRPRMAEGGGGGFKGKERQRMNRIGGSPSAQLQPFEPGEFNPDEDPGQDDDDDPAEDEEPGEGANEEGDATEEDEDDEDDEDEYPDAGHRAESLGMEDPEEEERQRRGRYGYGAVDDTSEDEDVG